MTLGPQEYRTLQARICHAAWVAFQMGAGQPYNEEPTEAQIASHIDGLRALADNPDMTPAQNHENWIRYRLAEGWQWGSKKDEDRKLDPDIVDFDRLPAVEREKDRMDLFARRFSHDIIRDIEIALSDEG